MLYHASLIALGILVVIVYLSLFLGIAVVLTLSYGVALPYFGLRWVYDHLAPWNL